MNTKRPVRLGKKDNVDNDFFCDSSKGMIGGWVTAHPTFCLTIMIVIFSLIFVALIYAIMGVSATESNAYYYHLKGGV